MADFRRLTDNIWASPQVDVADIQMAAENGFTLIINNRPDGEEAAQPGGESIAAAAEAAGLGYVAIPIDHSGMSGEQIDQMAQTLASAGQDAKILAYCRSGTRSTFLWALAQARGGAEPDSLIMAAAEAGYDLGSIRPALCQLAAKARA